MKIRTAGYIIPLTLMIVSAAVIIVTYLYTRGSVFVPFVDTVLKREQAKRLALSGVQVAMSQLAKPAEPKAGAEAEAKEGQPKKATDEEQAKQLLTAVLPTLNRWQTFALKENIDGIDGEIKICVCCEHGKININQIYDFDKQKFRGEGQPKGDWKKFLQEELFKRIENLTRASKLFEALEKFLKGRGHALDDVTQLLPLKEFEQFKNSIFYEPPGKEKEEKRPLYLADIFTLYSNTEKIDPWLFSDSMLGVIGLKRAQAGDVEKRKKALEQWVKPFKRTAKWETDWKTRLAPLYEKELQALPKGLEPMLSPTFDPTIFSVISYASVGAITQRVYAIVERVKRSLKDKTVFDVKIRKFYSV